MSRTITTEDFIKKAKAIHGDKYDYSLVDYKNCKIKVKIICPIHGVFEQTPDKHLNDKNGCKKCKKEFIKNENCHIFSVADASQNYLGFENLFY